MYADEGADCEAEARMMKSPDVSPHYSHEFPRFDPWSVTAAVRCPVLALTGEDDPLCPLAVVEELASRLPAGTTRLARLPGARPRLAAGCGPMAARPGRRCSTPGCHQLGV
jgi:pimeloyl-ACP methyl ester carboxylesterase